MRRRFTRRDFVRASAAAGIAATAPRALAQKAPAVVTGSVKPVVISSANGNWFKNGGNFTCVEKAFTLMMAGSDVLDALIEGVNIVELDPEDYSVGYGGVPNSEGVVQLDSSCMHGPLRRAGGVAALEGVRTPSRVAREVMNKTDHHLLVGKGAQWFARNMGFTIEEDLNTPLSRKLWLEWKQRTDPSHYLTPKEREIAYHRVRRDMADERLFSGSQMYGTINCDGINAKGEICGVTTTSGLFFKIPGRVGDSPILGAGLYVDGAVGAAGSTGRGEANLYNLSSFYIVDCMRRGMHPKDAGMEALKRIKANTIEKRLRKANGDPNFNINFYALNAKGEFAGVAMYAEDPDDKGWAGGTTNAVRYAVCDASGPRSIPVEGLLPGSASA
ncbi:MAG TPA: N(4)-(beta-N-acetylglucosaminyl)-L-asparaginase [Thermoanaerobaculia bacterium]|nr:N(4)-(beta-N-acetylglucosaminyl)-L-asparaginase [Thermoanaerobaculia bacterium]